MTHESLAELLHKLQLAAHEVLAAAPLHEDAHTRALASEAGVHLATIVTPGAISIELVADRERVEIFRFEPGRYEIFETEEGA